MPTRELVSRDLHRMALGGEELPYVLVRRRGRRGVGLKVDENGLTVNAPVTLSRARVEALVRESEQWVLRKVAEWRERRVPPVAWHDGAPLPFMGRTLTLRVEAGGRVRCEERADELVVSTPSADPASVQRAVAGWYKREARLYLAERVAALAQAASLTPPRFILSSAMGRWGSCNTRREVRLAWRLMKASPELIDYVVCHELAHLRHMNHSAAFWAEVGRQCPDYKRLRAQLFATDHLYRAF
jgi:predicted metal-dependent hydrolase